MSRRSRLARAIGKAGFGLLLAALGTGFGASLVGSGIGRTFWEVWSVRGVGLVLIAGFLLIGAELIAEARNDWFWRR